MQKRNKTQVGLDLFLKRIEELGWRPSFYCSRAYLEAVQPAVDIINGWLILTDEGVCMFPPVPMTTSVLYEGDFSRWPDFIWSDMEGCIMPDNYQKEKLDFQYLYDPDDFTTLEGKKWAIFRKNSKKWERRHKSNLMIVPWSDIDPEEMAVFIGEWLESKADDFQDADIMLKYLFQSNSKEVHAFCILDNNENIKAILAYDINWTYVNFRYCMTKPGEDFLAEAIRLLFYKELMFGNDMLVNDGGVVDNPQLEWFKDRLNPVEKKTVYSWRRVDE